MEDPKGAEVDPVLDVVDPIVDPVVDPVVDQVVNPVANPEAEYIQFVNDAEAARNGRDISMIPLNDPFWEASKKATAAFSAMKG